MSPDKVSNTLRDEGSMASAVSVSDARMMRRSDAFPQKVPDFVNPAPYIRAYTTDTISHTCIRRVSTCVITDATRSRYRAAVA